MSKEKSDVDKINEAIITQDDSDDEVIAHMVKNQTQTNSVCNQKKEIDSLPIKQFDNQREDTKSEKNLLQNINNLKKKNYVSESLENEQNYKKTEKLIDESSMIQTINQEQETIQNIDETKFSNIGNDHLNQKISRELKSILALSKEAKLDTNISRKRKIDANKNKEEINAIMADLQTTTKKTGEFKTVYPVTAETELIHNILNENVTDKHTNKKVKRKYSLNEPATEGARDDHGGKNIKSMIKFPNEIKMLKPNKDMFCWRCHREGVSIACETCPRSYHQKCLKQTITNSENWPCPECVVILKAENVKTRSKSMKEMTLEQLCGLLKFAVKRMMQCADSEPFIHPVNEQEFPDYKKYIIQSMNIMTLEKNIKNHLYGSPQAFEADAKWILHNSIVFNSYQSKLTTAAKFIIKICKQEMAEIENCPSCYLNANTKKNSWFIEVCPKPHLLVWAKLKGFPYWPGKVMCVNQLEMVDVRFFGAHDRAWVHYTDCFLYSIKDPNSNKQKKNDIIQCIKELELYVENLKKIYGDVNYAPFKTLFDPNNQAKQLRQFLPGYKSLLIDNSCKSVKNMEGVENLIKTVSSEHAYSSNSKLDCSETSLDSSNSSNCTSLTLINSQIVETKIGKENTINNKEDSVKTVNVNLAEDDTVIAENKFEQKSEKAYNSMNILSPSSSDISIKSTSDNSLINLESKLPGESNNDKRKTQVEGKETEHSSLQNKLKMVDHLMKKLTKKSGNTVESVVDKNSSVSNVDNQKLSLTIQECVQKQFEKREDHLVQKNEFICDSAITSDNSEKNELSKNNNSNKVETSLKDPTTDLVDEVVKLPEDLEIDTETIRNIIHSSLNNKSISLTKKTKADVSKSVEKQINMKYVKCKTYSGLKRKLTETPEKESKNCIQNLIQQKETIQGIYKGKIPITVSNNNVNISTNSVSTLKRKLSYDSSKDLNVESTVHKRKFIEKIDKNASDRVLQSKLVKLVPIENILQKKDENLEITKIDKSGNNVNKKNISQQEGLVVLKEVRFIKSNKQEAKTRNETLNEVEQSSIECDVQIKSEPDTETDMNDTDYIKAKRQYLSALNISEKQENSNINKPNEIRTRSKAEKRKAKLLDNVSTNDTNNVSQNSNIETVNEIYVKPLAAMQELKYKARKSFPMPSYSKKNVNNTSNVIDINNKTINLAPKVISATVKPISSVSFEPRVTNNLLIVPTYNAKMLSQNHAITYSTNPVITVVSPQINKNSVSHCPSNDITTITNVATINDNDKCESQNYIPQNKISTTQSSDNLSRGLLSNSSTVIINNENNINENQDVENELDMLNEILPENISKHISEIFCPPPPKLKPKPTGLLSTIYDEGIPASAGPIATKINSVAHRISDYFRGLLTETLSDFGKCNNTEATITNLKLEIETLKYNHNLELIEIRKNITTILRDIQKIIVEEREKIINETKIKCEQETIKRVDEAKSKQWCANCLKEAQFYCCWNTSYCDYPCQQKHWPKHLNKCTQNTNQDQITSSTSIRQIEQSSTIQKENPIKTNDANLNTPKVITKPAAGTSVTSVKGTPSHLTLVKAPVNYELLSNGSIAINRKILATTSFIGKMIGGNILTVTSASNDVNTSASNSSKQSTLSSTELIVQNDTVHVRNNE